MLSFSNVDILKFLIQLELNIVIYNLSIITLLIVLTNCIFTLQI